MTGSAKFAICAAIYGAVLSAAPIADAQGITRLNQLAQEKSQSANQTLKDGANKQNELIQQQEKLRKAEAHVDKLSSPMSSVRDQLGDQAALSSVSSDKLQRAQCADLMADGRVTAAEQPAWDRLNCARFYPR